MGNSAELVLESRLAAKASLSASVGGNFLESSKIEVAIRGPEPELMSEGEIVALHSAELVLESPSAVKDIAIHGPGALAPSPEGPIDCEDKGHLLIHTEVEPTKVSKAMRKKLRGGDAATTLEHSAKRAEAGLDCPSSVQAVA